MSVDDVMSTTWSEDKKSDVIWYTNEKGKLKIDTIRTLQFLRKNGFNILMDKSDRRANWDIIKVEDKQIKQHDMDTIRGFVYEYFNDKPSEWWDEEGTQKYGVSKIPMDKENEQTWSKMEVINHIFNKLVFSQTMIGFQIKSTMNKPFTISTLPLMEDRNDEVYLPFNNKIVHITPDSINAIDYKDMSDRNNLIWESQKRSHNISIEEEKMVVMEGLFSQFCRKSTSSKFKPLNEVSNWKEAFQENDDVMKSLMTSYGYMISHFNNPSKPVAPIYMDGDSEIGMENGRNGKSLVMLSLKYWKETISSSGKDFNPNQLGNWGNVTLDTKFICINDIRSDFNFESLYDRLSDDFEVRPLYSNKFVIPSDMKPKIGITSNYPIVTKGGSGRHRVHTTPFSSYWLTCIENGENPSDKNNLGKMLFKYDFTHHDWNQFYNFGFLCVQSHLQNGLHYCDTTEQQKKSIIRKYEGDKNDGVVEWWIGIIENNKMDGLLNENGVHRSDIYDRFTSEFKDELLTILTWRDETKFYKMLHGVTMDMGWDWNPHKSNFGDSMNNRKWIIDTIDGKQIQGVRINK